MNRNRTLGSAFLLITLAYVLLILIASFMPAPDYRIFSSNNWMYFWHFVEYLILSLLLFMTLFHYGADNPHLVTFTLAILVAVGTELVQVFIPYRAFNPLDIGTDGLGALATLLIVGFIR